MRFLNSVTVPKNVKGGGTLWDFLSSIVLQRNRNKRRGDPLVESKKVQRKVA